MRAGQVDKEVGEVYSAEQSSNGRHDDIIDNEFTSAPKAIPMMTPTAKSITLPRKMKALNSAAIFFMNMLLL